MGQAKNRGTFEERQAEAVAVEKTRAMLAKAVQDRRRAIIAATPVSNRLSLAAIIAGAMVDVTNGRKETTMINQGEQP